jgi:DNA-binding transcriptional MocR family regulator
MSPSSTLYRRLAAHYLDAMQAGTLAAGDRFPSVRRLMSTHEVSLSTALQTCRYLEDQGWLEARPRSGYYVQRPRRRSLPPAQEPTEPALLDPADYVGIHARISEILARGQQQPVQVNLALAVGDPELYPTAALQRSMHRLLRQQPALLTTMVRRHGHPALRQALVRRALARGIAAAPEELVVTHGCIEAVNLALRAVTRPGGTVAVESPTFYGLLQVLESLGLRALEIPASPLTGLSLDALAFAFEQNPDIQAVVSMPTLHNPLGTVMPDAHKERLVRLCTERAVPLIEDDIYGDMGSDDTPFRAAKAWDREGQVIYCQSLNKLIAPGLRLGWMLAGRWQARVEMLKYTQSRFVEELPQQAVAEFVDSAGFDRHLHRLRQALRQQREQMAECIARYFPAGSRLTVPEGGMLLWVQLPEGVSADALFGQALNAGIKLSPGTMFTNSRRGDGFIRLSCGRLHTPAVEGAVRELGAIIGRLQAG